VGRDSGSFAAEQHATIGELILAQRSRQDLDDIGPMFLYKATQPCPLEKLACLLD
jgi:hypothetical protein